MPTTYQEVYQLALSLPPEDADEHLLRRHLKRHT